MKDIPISRFQSQYALAVIGLPSPPSTYIYGENVKKNLLGSIHEVFIHEIAVEYSAPKKINILRLPANVQQRLLTVDPDTLDEERKTMRSVLSQVNGEIKFHCGEPPLRSVVVSQFASPRTLPSGKTYYHSGLDYRAYVGRPVLAALDGRVAYTGEMTIPGRLVVLDHGGGLYSRYLHLSEIKTRDNEFVKKKELIGLAGSTGRVEAPHLHWEIVWKGNHADPLRFLAALEPFCDPK